MDIINFVGLVLGFIGSVLLSAGLLKSKEAAIDEETPFWGENPFKMRGVLTSRSLALWGFALFVAGFATTAMVGLAGIIHLKSMFGVIAGSLALTFFGWLLVALIMQQKALAHKSHKNAHFKKAVVERLNMQIKSLKDILASPNPKNYDFSSVKYGNLELLVKHIPDIDREARKKLEVCLEKIKGATEFADIKEAMENCLAELGT
ncbi:MAG TPA: hypothetical protein VLF59_01410 [Candidatus Saccharimonadales bacterium]|nr:hypothetical protein [Candidatus Saccharimonadales bacterium]